MRTLPAFNYSLIKRKGIEAYVNLLVLKEQLKSFTAKVTVIDESWTYLRHGPKRENLWIWLMVYPSLLRVIGDYKTFSFLLILCLRVRLIILMITPFIKFLIITLQVRSTRLRVITLTVGLIWLGWLGILGLSIGVREWLIIVFLYLQN